VTEDSDFCPHCGSLFDRADDVMCDLHGSSRAEGVCIICRTVVCSRCAKKVRGRWLCRIHVSVNVEQDWALVFESPDINEAEFVRSLLESVGLLVVVRNFGPNNVVWDGGGDSLFSRQALNRPAKVFVPIPEYVQARDALADWEAMQHHEHRQEKG
jgi:hypothetical protein